MTSTISAERISNLGTRIRRLVPGTEVSDLFSLSGTFSRTIPGPAGRMVTEQRIQNYADRLAFLVRNRDMQSPKDREASKENV